MAFCTNRVIYGNNRTLSGLPKKTSRMTVKTSIIVVNTNEKRYVGNCLTSLLNLQSQEIEIIVVDNGSTDGSVEYIAKQFPSVKVFQALKNPPFTSPTTFHLHSPPPTSFSLFIPS